MSLPSAIWDYCFGSEAVTRSRTHKFQILLKVLAFGFAVAGCVPNIPIALKFGGTNHALGYTTLVANFISRTSLCTWSYYRIIDGVIGSRAWIKGEIAKRYNIAALLAIKLLVFMIALVGQTPRAYLAYSYNGYNILYPILTYMALTAVPACSLDLTARSMLTHRRLSRFEIQVDQIRQRLLNRIKNCRSKLVNLPAEERSTLVQHLTPLDQSPSELAIFWFLSQVHTEGTCRTPSTLSTLSTLSKLSKVNSWIIRFLTLITVAAQLGYYFWIGAQAAKTAWANVYFMYVVGSLIVLSNIYLTIEVMFKSSTILVQQATNHPRQLITGGGISTIPWPKINAGIGLLILTVSALSVGTTVQPIRDYFQNSPLYIPVLILAPMSIFMLGRNALADLSDNICKLLLHRVGIESELLRVDRGLERLEFVVDQISVPKFVQLLLTAPPGLYLDLALPKEALVDSLA